MTRSADFLTQTLKSCGTFASVARNSGAGVTPRTLPIALVQSAVSFALRQGWDVNGVLHEAGIPPMLLAEGRARITEQQAVSVVRTMWRLTDDEMFGVGPSPLPRGSFRLVCHAVIGAPDMGAMLARFEEFAAAIPALPAVHLIREDETARWSFHFRDPGNDPEHLMAMVALTVTHRILAWAIGRPIPLTRVELSYPEPPSRELYDLLFGAPSVFGADRAGLVFDAELLGVPIMRDEKALDAFIARAPADFLVRRDHSASLPDQVRKVVEHGLRGTHPTGDLIAAGLSISPQTLRRKLAAHGTSLREIREGVLRDTAITALAQGDETIAQLSDRLGFSEPSAFTRAFRRWTGSPPRTYRSSGE
jgi:AraC-like DNA-binding protein